MAVADKEKPFTELLRSEQVEYAGNHLHLSHQSSRKIPLLPATTTFTSLLESAFFNSSITVYILSRAGVSERRNWMWYGYAGNFLRVDLTTRSSVTSATDPELIEHYIGGKGFGTWLLHNEVNRERDPLHPSNPLFFVVGPVTGTIFPTASRYGVFFRSPLTGIYGESYSGGSFAPELKRAGVDTLIIKGRAEKPTYLRLNDGNVEFREAGNLWGLDTYQTEDSIRRDLDDSKVKVASIGPAGESLVKFACICNDYWRQAGRCGAGAVMGSKRLKAIAVRGTGRIETAKPDELREFVRQFIDAVKKDPALGTSYPKYGTPALVNITNLAGVFPTRYWRKGQLEKYEEISAEAMRERILISSKASLVKEYEDRFAIFDSLILCRFLRDIADWNAMAKLCRLTTGVDLDEKRLRSTAERIVNQSRLFNVKMGITRKDDYLPNRLMEEPLENGPLKGQSISKAEMDSMLDEYYRLRGWDCNGIPTQRT